MIVCIGKNESYVHIAYHQNDISDYGHDKVTNYLSSVSNLHGKCINFGWKV